MLAPIFYWNPKQDLIKRKVYVMHNSEVAHLHQQITLECQALNRALHGPAGAASHAVVANHYKQIDQYYNQLIALIGEQQATEMTVDLYASIVK